jgi:methyl-accepting chemotaxis protein-3 (ribose and galactose sensor receptor)
MEQLTATVKQNADNAHHASKLAEDASGKASRGGQMVSGVVKTMGNISTSSKKSPRSPPSSTALRSRPISWRLTRR